MHPPLHYTLLHHATLYFISLLIMPHYTSLHHTTLHAAIPNTTPHYTTLHHTSGQYDGVRDFDLPRVERELADVKHEW
jgi:hypothetical protein